MAITKHLLKPRSIMFVSGRAATSFALWVLFVCERGAGGPAGEVVRTADRRVRVCMRWIQTPGVRILSA